MISDTLKKNKAMMSTYSQRVSDRCHNLDISRSELMNYKKNTWMSLTEMDFLFNYKATS